MSLHPMTFGSVCSGIECASAAWIPLGWKCAWTAEIEPFPSAVIQERWGHKNYGDFTKIGRDAEPIDLLAGGTPCQDFSVAGLRAGMAGERGNLTLEFLRLADRLKPRWIVWENVPGVLSSNNGKDFGAFIGGLGECGYGFAYRILNAEFAGVPQRRRRVFVVGHLGDWRRAAAVLFERESMQGHPPPSREKGQRTSGGVEVGPSGGRFTDTCPTIDSRAKDGFIRNQLGAGVMQETVGSLCADSHPGAYSGQDAYTGEEHAVAFTLPSEHRGIGNAHNTNYVPTAFTQNQCGDVLSGEVFASMGTNQNATGRNTPKLQSGMAVRRLTPRECERLQGLPDNYTAITYRGKPAADGPRYKAIGNGWAIPDVRWIGQRIEMVDSL